MKQLLQQYASYNTWANKLMVEKIASLSPQILQKEIPSSFPSIYDTVVHMADVESIWWQRLRLLEKIELQGKSFEGDFDKLSKYWLLSSRQWQDWVMAASDGALEHVFAYQSMKKEYFKQPVYEVLIHLFNHQTYHRGQLVTMMRIAGVDKIPGTDFILFTRGKKN